MDDDAIRDHFESVKERMKSESSGGGGDDNWEEIPEQNEMTKGIRKR